MAIRLEQTKTGTSTLASTVITWDSNTVSGNTIIVAVATNLSTDVSGITDSQGNVYVNAFVANGTGVEAELWYAKNILGGATPTVTIAYTSGPTASAIIREYSGIDTVTVLDQTKTGTGNSNSLDSGSTTKINQQLELLIGVGAAISATFTVGSGFINLSQQANATIDIATEDQFVTSTNTYNATFGASGSAQWACGIASFRALPQGTTTSTSSTSSTSSSTSSTSSSTSSTSSSTSSTSTSTSSTSVSTSSTSRSTSTSSTSSSTSSTSSSTSSTSTSSTSSSTSVSSTSSSISSTSFSSTSTSSTSSSTSVSSTSSSISSTSSSISSTSQSTSSTSASTSSTSSSTSTTTVPPPYITYSYQDFNTITFDTSNSAPTQATSPLAWSHTIGGGLNRLLVVCIAVGGTTQGTTTAVTFKGVAMTKVRGDQGANAGAGWKNETSIWFLHNPPIGTYTISATLTVPTSPDIAGASMSYFGAEQVSTADAVNGTNGTTSGVQSTSVTTVEKNSWVVGICEYSSDSASQSVVQSRDTRRQYQAMSAGLDGVMVASDSGSTVVTGPRTIGFNLLPGGATNFMYAISAASFSPSIANGNSLTNPFNSVNYGNVSTNDGDYFITYGSEYMIQVFKKRWINNTDNLSITIKLRSTESTLISPMLLQIYNITTAAWETLDTETLQPADTDFIMQASQTSNLSNYYDSSNIVTFRVYQQVV